MTQDPLCRLDYPSQPIFTRRSIRTYLPKPVPRDALERILRAGMQAPTAMDGRGWELYVFESPKAKETIAQMSPYAAMAKEAAAVIVVCANQQVVKENREESWWVQGLSACTQNILLQIVQEGMGGVWLGCYPREARVEYLQKQFQIPDHIQPFAVIPFGYSDEPNVYEDRFDPARVHMEQGTQE